MRSRASVLALAFPLLTLAGCAVGSEADTTASGADKTSYGATVDAGTDQAFAPARPSAVVDGDGADAASRPAPAQWRIGGRVTGLVGSGLVLQQSGRADLPVDADGGFVFDTKLATGDAFDVTVALSPSAPAQSCVVAGGSGTVAQGNVVSIAVNCTTDHYTVGGTVTGLTGSGLVLTSGGVDVAVAADGTWAFPDVLPSGATYDVSIKAHPADETCWVARPAGTVGGVPVADIAVTCTPYVTVGGTVTGLTGSLVLAQSGGDDLTVTSDGPFAFGTRVPAGSVYAVTVKAQPADQFCSLRTTTNIGYAAAEGVTTVDIACTTFTNPSFDDGFAGWNVTRSSGALGSGGLTAMTGTMIHPHDVLHDAVSDADVSFGVLTTSIGIGPTSPSSGSKLAFAYNENGPCELVATHDLVLSANVTYLRFEMQYVKLVADQVPGSSHVSVELRDVETDAMLQRLHFEGAPPVGYTMASLVADVSAFAGHAVRLALVSGSTGAPLYTTFDNFRLD
ncbi:MAG: hypothetical protein JWP97_4371 [Labilithrix sp.]|nr:hypothetical protein [Labilithrix sp.]